MPAMGTSTPWRLTAPYTWLEGTGVGSSSMGMSRARQISSSQASFRMSKSMVRLALV